MNQEISQIRTPAMSRLRMIPALLLKAGYGLSAFGRLPDREYLQWVFEANGLAANMAGALDRVRGPADLVLDAWAAERADIEAARAEKAARDEDRRRRVLAHLRRASQSLPPGQVLYADESILRGRS